MLFCQSIDVVITNDTFYWFFLSKSPLSQSEALLDTEAKRCFATHDEDNDYFNMRIYIILIACVYIQQFNFIQ